MTFTPGKGSTSISYEPPLAGVQMQPSVPQITGECGDYKARLRAVPVIHHAELLASLLDEGRLRIENAESGKLRREGLAARLRRPRELCGACGGGPVEGDGWQARRLGA